MRRVPLTKVSLLLALLLLPSAARAEIDPLKRVAEELADGISRMKGARVAVLPLPHQDSHPSDGPVVVSEKIETYLVTDKRFVVLERNQISQVLEELHLSETGAIDAASAKRIGQALGANIIVTGTLIDLNDHQTELNVRGVRADNGRILVASRTMLPRTWASRPILAW